MSDVSTRALRLFQAFVVAGCLTFLLVVVIAGGSDQAARRTTAGFDLRAAGPGGPAGIVHLHGTRVRLTGTVAVWGLAPGSRHYAALRGPAGRCGLDIAQVAAAVPALVADRRGVAVARIDLPALSETFAEGLALTVHATEAKRSPVLACGTTLEP